MKDKIVMPLQPIVDGRFVENRIVSAVLAVSQLNLNDIACMDFTDQEQMQFAQLIGYSLGGFADLSYVDDETYSAACNLSKGVNEVQSRNQALRSTIDEIRMGLKMASCAAFRIAEEDLKS